MGNCSLPGDESIGSILIRIDSSSQSAPRLATSMSATLDKHLNLVFYLPSLGGGGAERLLAGLATTLALRGHDIIFATDTEAPENKPLLCTSVEVVLLGASHVRSTLALAHLLRERRPDVSLSGLCGQNLKHLVAAALAGRLDRAVQSYHGFFESEPRPLSRLSYLLTPLSSRIMARTIAVSGTLRRELLTRFYASPTRTELIYNGSSTTFLPNRAKKSPRTILACGRLSPDKNFPFLIRAFARIAAKEARLVILGEGPMRSAIEAEVRDLGITGRVDLPGYRDPAPYYAQACCLAMTSTRETFGLVIIEALAAGLPIVTTDSGGPTELGGDLVSIVAQGDETVFAAALDTALALPGDPVARRARAQQFSMNSCANAYEALFWNIACEARLAR
jgi:glycosyltransferase involved in cell wall biosynthesis